jgi:hypothetical protein
VRYEEGGGIWPHTDVADNEITLTLQLEVAAPLLSPLSCSALFYIFAFASQLVLADSRWRLLATARSPEQWHQCCCAHERQRRSALLRQQACPLAGQDAGPLHRYADDIRLETLQRKRMRRAVSERLFNACIVVIY